MTQKAKTKAKNLWKGIWLKPSRIMKGPQGIARHSTNPNKPLEQTPR